MSGVTKSKLVSIIKHSVPQLVDMSKQFSLFLLVELIRSLEREESNLLTFGVSMGLSLEESVKPLDCLARL